MTISNHSTRGLLRGGAALQALALLGAGLAATVAVSAPASAQDFTNVSASGRVTGPDGAAIAGATVTVTSNTQGFSRSTTTSDGGVYRIPALPQGEYTFEVSAPGFATFTDPAVELTQGSAGNSFRLASADAAAATPAAGDVIVVTGARIQVSDFDRATTGAVIEVADIADRIPVSRDLTSIVLLAPGTGQGDSAYGNLASVSGSSVSENAFFLNGLNITDFRQGLGAAPVPFNFYETVEVKNGGIPAEFGRFTGGFINAITKSGGNEFHGEVLFSWQPDGLTEDSPNTLASWNQTDYTEDREAVFSLSGPIIPDRLFFYGFYQANDRRTEDTFLSVIPSEIDDNGTPDDTSDDTAVAPYSLGNRRDVVSSRSPFFGGKIDGIITDGHRLEFTYFDTSGTTIIDSYDITYNDGPDGTGADPVLGGFEGREVLRTGGENYVGRYTGQFTDWFTLSAAYGKNNDRTIQGSSADDYPFISDNTGRFNPALTGNPTAQIIENKDTREFYRADADVYVELFGQHHFKAGYDREELTTVALNRRTGGLNWTYVEAGAGDPTGLPEGSLYVTGRTFINGGTFNSLNEAFYIQDSWSLFDNRLTLNLGVRNDRFSNDNVAGETYYESGDNWAPRLAFTADPFGTGRTKVYGSYGRYYLPIVSNTNVRLAGAEIDYTRFFEVAGVNPDNTPILGAPLTDIPNARACPDTGVANCQINSDGDPTPTEATVSKSLTNQSVDEYIIGAEQNFGESWTFGIYGVYRTLNESLEDAAIDAAVINYCVNELGIPETPGSPTGGCEDIWTGFHQYVLINPGAPSTITLSDPVPGETDLRTIDFTAAQLGYPKAKRTYKAVTVTFDREFDDVWSLAGSYTWSETKGNAEGGVLSDIGQTDSGLTQSFDQPGLTDGTFGFLPTHRAHRFKVYGSYAVTDWLTVGAQFQAESPRKFGCIGRVPATRDRFAGQYGAAGFYCHLDSAGNIVTDPTFDAINDDPARVADPRPTTLGITPRGSVFESDWTTFTNLTASFRVPSDLFDATFRVDVFNVFNEQAVTDLSEFGTLGSGRPRGDYGTPRVYQTPRYFRFQLGVGF